MTEPVTEYGIRYTSGGYLTLPDSPEVGKIYPVASRIADTIHTGGHVCRRRIIVVEDWEEITEAPEEGEDA